MWFRGCPKNNIFLHKHSPVLLDASVCTQTCSSWMFCWPSPPSTPTPSQHCWDSCPQSPSWASPCLRQACSSFHQRSCKNSFLDSPFSYVNFELTFIEVSIPKWLVLDSTYPCQKHFPIHLVSKWDSWIKNRANLLLWADCHYLLAAITDWTDASTRL